MTINKFSYTRKIRENARGLSTSICLSVTAITALVIVPGSAEARELRYAFGNADTHPGYISVERFVERVSEDGGLNIRLFTTSLLTASQVAGGLRDGMADIGWLTHPYHPAEFAESNLISSLSMLATIEAETEVPGAAMNGATMEYTMLHCPDCLEQFKERNLVYTGGASTAPYNLLCNTKVSTLEELQGKRIRAGAGNFERWASHFEATGVSMPGNEIYGALGQGVVDCTANGTAELLGFRFIDVTSSITLGVPGGVYSGMAPAIFRRSTWQELDTEQRTIVLEAASQLAADTVVAWYQSEQEGMTAAQEKGIEILEAPDDLKEATAEFVEQDLETVQEQFSEHYGVNNVAEKSAKIRELVEKWQDLTKDIGTDADALAEVYWNEVLSKVNPNTYGMD